MSNYQNFKHRSQSAFTLIELMIVIAIIGILGAIAYPSYQESVRTSRRSDAMAALLEESQRAERYYSINGTYVGWAVAGSTSEEGFYTIATSATPTASAFALTATPTGVQNGDSCGTFSINQLNARLPTACW